MLKQSFFLITGVCSVVLVSACSPDCCHQEKPLSKYAGLWDSSVRKAEGVDRIYTRIATNGDTIEYDFDGDSVDKGLDCYTVETGSIQQDTDNYFIVKADMHEHVEFKVALRLLDAGKQLKVTYLQPVSTGSGDFAGSSSAGFVPYAQVWTRVVDDRFSQNEPSCKNR